MRSEQFIAFKFMLRGSEKGRFSSMTLFAWLAIGIGVAAMGCLLSVMYGFETALKERVLQAYPHILARPIGEGLPEEMRNKMEERLRLFPGVTELTSFLEQEMIVEVEERALGAVVCGVPPKRLESIKKYLGSGRLPSREGDVPEIMVGAELARRLIVTPGDYLQIVSPVNSTGPMGMIPNSRKFKVVGIFTTGHYEFDQQYLYLTLEDAQELLGKGQNELSGWQIWLDHLEKSDWVAREMRNLLGAELVIQSWTELNSALFESLKLEQYAMFCILLFAIGIAVLGIVITLIMYVTQKKRNIGILRSLGASAKQIRKIFIWQGTFLGLVGLLFGVVLTISFIVYVRNFSTFQLPDIYYDRSIPVEIRPLSMGLIYGIAILMIFLSTLYPAKKASQIAPIEAIRE